MPIIDAPLLDRPWPWDKIVTAERPRKCPACTVVYPPDHPDAPIVKGGLCEPCVKSGKKVEYLRKERRTHETT